MLKRIFWLSAIAICGWLAWQWFRQRQGEFGDTTPHLAPHSYTPPAESQRMEGPPAADPDEALAPAMPGQAPAAADAPPAVRLDSPEAPPPTIATHEIDELFAEDGPASTAAPATAEAAAPAAPAQAAMAQEAAPPTAEAPTPAAPAQAAMAQEVVGYCMRCRTKRPIKNAHEEISESGRRAARGTCPACGTNMFVFLAAGDERGATQ